MQTVSHSSQTFSIVTLQDRGRATPAFEGLQLGVLQGEPDETGREPVDEHHG